MASPITTTTTTTNNNKLNLAPMPLTTICRSTQNISSVASSSGTPLKNHRMYDPKMNRLIDVKRLARNRRKFFPKKGPFPCQWCVLVFQTSPSFAGHMHAHYRAEIKALKAERRTQELSRMTKLEAWERALAKAQPRVKPKLASIRARARAEKQVLRQAAQTRAKAKVHAPLPPQARPVPRIQAPVQRAHAPTQSPTSMALSSSSVLNDVHLRLVNSPFGLMCAPGDKNNSMSTNCIANAMDFLYSKRLVSQNSSPADVCQHHQASIGFGSNNTRPPKYIKKKLTVVKQEVFPEEDVKPPPGFLHLLTIGHEGRQFIKHEKIEFDDVDESGSTDNLTLKL